MVHRHVDQMVPHYMRTDSSAGAVLADDLEETSSALPYTCPEPPASAVVDDWRAAGGELARGEELPIIPEVATGVSVPSSPVADPGREVVPHDQPQALKEPPPRRELSARVRRRPAHLADYVE